MPAKKTTKRKPPKKKVAKKKTAAKKPVKKVTKKKTKRKAKPKYVNPAPHLIGRPTLLNNVIRDKICLLLRAGNYIETACNFVGINREVYFDWMRKGNKAKSGIYFEFATMVKQAQAENEYLTIGKIMEAGNARDRQGNLKNWTAHAWRMERKHPTRWGRKKQIEIISDDQNNTEIDLTPEEAEEIMGKLNLDRYKKETI